ncbi:AraC family transcriptional regulator [Domibacillus sp. DTU_2020_1001157_1_SI_ALB_TIR_016]|uniref:AraC family transcriptional regulator n=1 Tax=Domibacillus sp. DTU_2020_1001157_1_SI_ALB_TIR_016 TaxID=3077789 RepID=UPI0028E69335|nr:AraC family transcriptional regulator [Domibacillus sp. DTU_2020_1001157_1_SI_ALB_TIR_016]WNS78915.1 AraC family transcriptional regulator [Domibacillus sp. DTU_2020_1001157_1_SI_ALB_TIR_016]
MYDSEVTQKVIAFIERNLTEDLQLNSFPAVTGYSKHHWLRVFKQETGKSIGEYIRIRRLAMAATLLLHSEKLLITIAFYFTFNHRKHSRDV